MQRSVSQASFSSSSGYKPVLPMVHTSRARTAKPPSADASVPRFMAHTVTSSRVLDWATQGGVTARLGPLGHARWSDVVRMGEARAVQPKRRLLTKGEDDENEDGEDEMVTAPQPSASLDLGASMMSTASHASALPLYRPPAPGSPLLDFNRTVVAATSRALPPQLRHLAAAQPRPGWTPVKTSSFAPTMPGGSTAWQGGRQGGRWVFT